MAELWIASLIETPGEPRTPTHVQAAPYAGVLRGKCLITGTSAGWAKKWLDLADWVLANARALRCLMGEIYCHIISACALQATGDRERAESALKTALDAALPDRLYMPFAEHFLHLQSAFCSLNEMIPKEALDKIRPLAEQLSDGAKAIAGRIPTRLPFGLSEREYEAASLAVKGYSNPEIADRLFISRATVRFHLGRAYKKIGVTSRSDLERAFSPK